MRRFLLITAGAFVLSACGSEGVSRLLEPDGSPRFAPGDFWWIFTTQTPASTLNHPNDPWEVGTQFYMTVDGCVTHLRFWRATGESGTNTVTLWTNSGTPIVSRAITASGTGWKSREVSSVVCLDSGVYYRVSATVNHAQVKTFGAFTGGPITYGPMVATSGYYGQPAGSMPTTQSSSNFFVDLAVQEQ